MTCFSGAEAYAKTTKRAIRRRWMVNFILIVDLMCDFLYDLFGLLGSALVYISKVGS